jgi:hypothetical protein
MHQARSRGHAPAVTSSLTPTDPSAINRAGTHKAAAGAEQPVNLAQCAPALVKGCLVHSQRTLLVQMSPAPSSAIVLDPGDMKLLSPASSRQLMPRSLTEMTSTRLPKPPQRNPSNPTISLSVEQVSARCELDDVQPIASLAAVIRSSDSAPDITPRQPQSQGASLPLLWC